MLPFLPTEFLNIIEGSWSPSSPYSFTGACCFRSIFLRFPSRLREFVIASLPRPNVMVFLLLSDGAMPFARYGGRAQFQLLHGGRSYVQNASCHSQLQAANGE